MKKRDFHGRRTFGLCPEVNEAVERRHIPTAWRAECGEPHGGGTACAADAIARGQTDCPSLTRRAASHGGRWLAPFDCRRHEIPTLVGCQAAPFAVRSGRAAGHALVFFSAAHAKPRPASAKSARSSRRSARPASAFDHVNAHSHMHYRIRPCCRSSWNSPPGIRAPTAIRLPRPNRPRRRRWRRGSALMGARLHRTRAGLALQRRHRRLVHDSGHLTEARVLSALDQPRRRRHRVLLSPGCRGDARLLENAQAPGYDRLGELARLDQPRSGGDESLACFRP